MSALRVDGTEFPIEMAVTRVDTPEQPLYVGYLARHHAPQGQRGSAARQ